MHPHLLILPLIGLPLVVCRPPSEYSENNIPHTDTKPPQNENDWDLKLEYNRYLQQVVETLQKDSEFRQKLEEADEHVIKSGDIAKEIQFLPAHIRKELDEHKRVELERHKNLQIMLDKKLRSHSDKLTDSSSSSSFPDMDHLHHGDRFSEDDLRRLIVVTSKRLEALDNERHDEFKEHEMNRKYQHDMKYVQDHHQPKTVDDRNDTVTMSGPFTIDDVDDKHAMERDWKVERSKTRVHNKQTDGSHMGKEEHPLHHPMSKDNLEQVWEEQDHMRPEDWDPKTFFYTHDLNGDGNWDQNEIKALLKKELDAAYGPNNDPNQHDTPSDTLEAPQLKSERLYQRHEEQERMREHIFNETDSNRDGFITFDEFLVQTNKDEFENDEGWRTHEDLEDAGVEEPFSEQEYQAYLLQQSRQFNAAMGPDPLHQQRMQTGYVGGVHPNFPNNQHPSNGGGYGQEQLHPPQAQFNYQQPVQHMPVHPNNVAGGSGVGGIGIQPHGVAGNVGVNHGQPMSSGKAPIAAQQQRFGGGGGEPMRQRP